MLLHLPDSSDSSSDSPDDAIRPDCCAVVGAGAAHVLVAVGDHVCLWADPLRAPRVSLRESLPRDAGRATAVACIDDHCCVVGTDRGRLILVDTADALGSPTLAVHRGGPRAGQAASNAPAGGLLSSIGAMFSWARAPTAATQAGGDDGDDGAVRLGAAVVGLLPLDASFVLVWTDEHIHVCRVRNSAARVTLSADVTETALPLLGATPDTRLRLLDAALVESDRVVLLAATAPRSSSARPPDEQSVRRLVLIDVAIDQSRASHTVGAAVVLPPSALPDHARDFDDDGDEFGAPDVRLVAAGDGCAYVVRATGVVCVDVEAALMAGHDAVQRHCVALPPMAVVAAGVQAGEHGPALLMTRAFGAFACARSAAAPRDIQRIQRAPVAALSNESSASLPLPDAIRAAFDAVRSLAPSATVGAGERVLALVQRASSNAELGAACTTVSAALLNAQPASHPHWAELGGSDRLSSLLSSQLEQKQQLHDALMQFFATRYGAVRMCDAFDAGSLATLARHSQAIRAARALRALQNEATTTALSEAIRATVGAWRAAEPDSDAWRAFGVHDHFFHSVLRVPEVLRQLARYAAQSDVVRNDVSGVQLRLCNDAFVVACRALGGDALRAAHVSGAVRAHTELVAAFVERQFALQREQRSPVIVAITEQLAALADAALAASDERTLLRDGGEAADADGALDAASFAALRGRLLPLLQRDCAEQHRALAERFRDFEALAELCEAHADGDALLQRYMQAYRADGFHDVVYRRYARLDGKHRALLLQQPESARDVASAFVDAWPQMRWPDQVRYGELDAAARSLLAAAAATAAAPRASGANERERSRTLCSLARIAAAAGGDRAGEARAVASLKLLRLGDVLLGHVDADADGVGLAAPTDFDDNDVDGKDADDGDERDDLLTSDSALIDADPHLLTVRATFVAALHSQASRVARVLRAALALQLWRAGALAAPEQAPDERSDLDVARRRVWREALSGSERWRRVSTSWVNGELSDAVVESAVRSSAVVQLARAPQCPAPLPSRDEALQLAFGGALRDGSVLASAVRLFDAVWLEAKQQHEQQRRELQ